MANKIMKDFVGKSVKSGDTVVVLVRQYRPIRSFLKLNVIHHIEEKDGVKYAHCSEYGIGYPSESIVKVKRNTKSNFSFPFISLQ